MGAKRTLVIEPHPDDFLLMCAGSARKWIKEGNEVYVVTFTNGGSVSSDVDKAKRERSAETAEADKIIGTTSREILNYDTRVGLGPPRQLYDDLVTRIRTIRPDLIITTQDDRRHPDHMWIARFIEPIVYQAGENIKFDWGQPIKVPVIWLGENPRRYLPNPDIHIDITETLHDKIAALRTQTSQIPVIGEDIFYKVTEQAIKRSEKYEPKCFAKYCEAFLEIPIYKEQ